MAKQYQADDDTGDDNVPDGDDSDAGSDDDDSWDE